MVAATATPALASSHREAPVIAGDPQVDNTDTYAFTSPDKSDTVTVIANFSPFELPPGGPNFYPFSNDARYNLNIDTDGDAVPNLTYRFTFSGGYQDTSTFLYATGAVNTIDDATLNFKQNYKVELVGADGKRDLHGGRQRQGGPVQRGQGLDAELRRSAGAVHCFGSGC